jgi:hypothetical protein
MGSPGSIRPWRKSRTFGDVYGGRSRDRVTDGIFNRAHSIDPPGPHDALPIVLEDNPSKKMVFPATSNTIVGRIKSLPEQDIVGITHLWLRRAKQSEHEAGAIPFGEFICGSGVRMIVVYPWPSDLTLFLGRTRPTTQRLREFAPWTSDSKKTDGLSSWTKESLERWCLDHLVLHEVGHHLDWYRRHWSKANHRTVEAAADSYAARWSSVGLETFKRGDRSKGATDTETDSQSQPTD